MTCAVPLISIEIIEAGVVRYQDVGPSVTVEVLEQDPQPVIVLLVGNARFLGHLTECTVAIVSI